MSLTRRDILRIFSSAAVQAVTGNGGVQAAADIVAHIGSVSAQEKLRQLSLALESRWVIEEELKTRALGMGESPLSEKKVTEIGTCREALRQINSNSGFAGVSGRMDAEGIAFLEKQTKTLQDFGRGLFEEILSILRELKQAGIKQVGECPSRIDRFTAIDEAITWIEERISETEKQSFWPDVVHLLQTPGERAIEGFIEKHYSWMHHFEKEQALQTIAQHMGVPLPTSRIEDDAEAPEVKQQKAQDVLREKVKQGKLAVYYLEGDIDSDISLGVLVDVKDETFLKLLCNHLEGLGANIDVSHNSVTILEPDAAVIELVKTAEIETRTSRFQRSKVL